MAYSRFNRQHTTQSLLHNPEQDERTQMQIDFDNRIARARLVINSGLNIQDGNEFIAELDAAQNRMEQQAVIARWQAKLDGQNDELTAAIARRDTLQAELDTLQKSAGRGTPANALQVAFVLAGLEDAQAQVDELGG